MKKNKTILLFVIPITVLCLGVFFLIPNYAKESKSGQTHDKAYSETFSITTKTLSDTKWEYDSSSCIEDIEFTDSIFINRFTYKSNGQVKTYQYSYYLSNYIPSRFDYNKVGKNNSGHYIIMNNNSGTFSDEIVWLGINELHLKSVGNSVIVYSRQ